MPPSDPSSSDNPNAHARFHGSISLELPTHRPDIQRTGYAAWRTLDRKGTIFGRSLWNIDPYVYLALRIKSDGRSYFVNVQTESVIRTDLHQHRLFARRPGQWETVLIRWSDFVRTNHGFVVEPQTELLRQKVKTIGIGLTDRVPGPFELCIERLWATNDNENENDNVTLNVAPQTPASEPEAAKAERPSSGDNGSGEAAITRSTALGGLKNKDGQAVKWTAGRT